MTHYLIPIGRVQQVIVGADRGSNVYTRLKGDNGVALIIVEESILQSTAATRFESVQVVWSVGKFWTREIRGQPIHRQKD